MSKTPYEIRLELLRMAHEMLANDYFTKKDVITSEWNVNVSRAHEQQTVVPPHPTMPKFPAPEEIIEKARVLNTFISNS